MMEENLPTRMLTDLKDNRRRTVRELNRQSTMLTRSKTVFVGELDRYNELARHAAVLSHKLNSLSEYSCITDEIRSLYEKRRFKEVLPVGCTLLEFLDHFIKTSRIILDKEENRRNCDKVNELQAYKVDISSTN